jgi:hypothetical protein
MRTRRSIAPRVCRLPVHLLHQRHRVQSDVLLPLSAMAKLLVAIQSLTALVTIPLVVARAVNVLAWGPA